MRIPTETVNFEEEGYTTEKGKFLWLKVPRSVREGYVYNINQLNQRIQSKGDDVTADDSRELAVEVLMLVDEWNFDDDGGTVLPTLKSLADDQGDERARVISEIPMEVINKVVEQVTGGGETSDDEKSGK